MSIEAFKEILSSMVTNRHLQVVVVLIISLGTAKIADLVLTWILPSLTRRTRSELDDQIIALLHRPIFTSVLLVGLGVALSLMDPVEPFGRWALGLTKTLVVLIWLIFGVRLSAVVLNWMTHHRERFHVVQPPTQPLFNIAAKLVLFGAAAYLLIVSWNLDVTGWIASAGIVGLALSLAAQDTIANLISGVSILTDAPYKVGDYVVLDGGQRGQVSKIGLRSTRILTRDHLEITIPNSLIANSRLINESGGPEVKQRIRLPLGVAYGSNLDQLEQVVLHVTAAESRISREPKPRLHFAEFGPSSLNFEVRVWIENPELRGQVISSLNSALYKTLGKAGIQIPFPQRDIYIKELPELRVSGTSQAKPVEKLR